MTPEQYEEWKHMMEEHKSAMSTLLAQQGKTMDLLKGNPLNPDDKGLLGKVKSNSDRIDKINERMDKLEKLKDRTIWVLYGAGAVTGWSVTGLLGKVTEFFRHH